MTGESGPRSPRAPTREGPTALVRGAVLARGHQAEPGRVGLHHRVGAARRLAQQETRAIPIVCGSALVGMLDGTDVARARPSAAPTLTIGEIEGRLSRVAVRQIVSAGVTAVGPRTPLTEAIRLMRA